jgi:hypothetical protein
MGTPDRQERARQAAEEQREDAAIRLIQNSTAMSARDVTRL